VNIWDYVREGIDDFVKLEALIAAINADDCK
jgi:hypothetical protein